MRTLCVPNQIGELAVCKYCCVHCTSFRAYGHLRYGCVHKNYDRSFYLPAPTFIYGCVHCISTREVLILLQISGIKVSQHDSRGVRFDIRPLPPRGPNNRVPPKIRLCSPHTYAPYVKTSQNAPIANHRCYSPYRASHNIISHHHAYIGPLWHVGAGFGPIGIFNICITRAPRWGVVRAKLWDFGMAYHGRCSTWLVALLLLQALKEKVKLRRFSRRE